MRSFGSIEKCKYQYHRVPTQEKPKESVYKFYPPVGSCTQTNSTPSPHTAPVTARNTPVWRVRSLIGRGVRPAKYRPKIPAFRGFLFYHNGIYLNGIFLYR